MFDADESGKTGHERVSSQQGNGEGVRGMIRSKRIPRKLLEILKGLTVSMDRMEASLERQHEKAQKGREASVFGSIVEQGRVMSREVLDLKPPRKPL